MLLQISFLTIRHREKEEALMAIEYVFFVRLCCLGASICLFRLVLSSHFFFSFFYTFITRWSKVSESIKKLMYLCVWFIRLWQCTIISLSLCLVFLFFTLVASSTTASSLEAYVDPMFLSLPSLKPLRHVGLIDVCVCVSNADANIERKS